MKRLQGLGRIPVKPAGGQGSGGLAGNRLGGGLQQPNLGLPLRSSFSKQAPAERQQAAQLSLQQRQQREREEEQQQQQMQRQAPARRQRRVVMGSSDEESEEDEQEKERQQANKRGKSLMNRVEEISEQLRAMLGTSNINERYAAVSEDQQASAGASGLTLVRREQVGPACGSDTAGTLKGYQLVGINFLTMLSRSGSAGGAILADEMGLGKTAQTICFLGLLQHSAMEQWRQKQQQAGAGARPGQRPEGPKPHLIVCPSSLLENWERELKLWCPKLRVITYYGKARAEKREIMERWLAAKQAAKKKGTAWAMAAAGGTGASSGSAAPSPGSGIINLAGSTEEGEQGSTRQAQPGEGEDLEEESSDMDEDEAICGFKLPDPASGASAPFDVLLITYTMFERDSMDARVDRALIKKWQWSHLVADEAHALKNSTSVRHTKLMGVAQECEFRILLTGTPLQNDLGELLALLRFLMPALFGSSMDLDDEAILGAELEVASRDEQAQASTADRMRRLLSPFILRRLKSEVAGQLVPKVHILKEVDMVPEQEEVYSTALTNMRAEVAAARAAGKKGDRQGTFEGVDKSLDGVQGARTKKSSSVQRTEAGAEDDQNGPSTSSGSGDGSNATALLSKLGGTRISNIFTHLRKIALHPLLVRHRYTDERVQEMAKIATSMQLFGGQCTYDRVLKEMISWSDHALHSFSVSNPRHLSQFALPGDAMMGSAKIKLLSEMLPTMRAKGNKILLFSQWTQVLDVLEWFMQREGFTYVRLDGSTNVQDRLTIVDMFNNPEGNIFIFLLSTRAGGQGLNLTGADTVILHDVDFNPQIDKQAEDRCHRLGQTRAVTVHRLVTRGTVDRNILDIAERKLRLDAAIMDGVTLGAQQQAAAAAGANTEEAEAEASEGYGKGVGKAGKAKGKGKETGAETKHMGAILAQLLAGQ